MPGLIAHEWIERHGGSENVLEAIAALYPDADLVTPWSNAPERFPNHVVRELWLARSPLRGRKALALGTLVGAWRGAVPRDIPYDWILASSHSIAHHIRPRGASRDAPKLVYAYTPARYVWSPELDVRGSGIVARAAAAALRPIDRRRAAEATAVAGISQFVVDRIGAAWQRDAEVIYPPVEVTAAQAGGDWAASLGREEQAVLKGLPGEFLLGASRFIPYKRLELVIAAGEASGTPVVLAGAGPEEARLRAAAADARVPVHLIIAPSTPLLYALYQAAAVFVFPPVEDFGIMPVEAMALGTPAVGSALGGSAETIADGVSGIHLRGEDATTLRDAIDAARRLDPQDARAWSTRFSRERFDGQLRDWVSRSVG